MLAIALYIPAVQNWVADKGSEIASEQTGMQISIGTIHIVWPLDVEITQCKVRSAQWQAVCDTLPDSPQFDIYLGRATVGWQPLALLDDNIDITNFEADSADIKLDLNYEAPEDTTKTEIPYTIHLNNANITNLNLWMMMKGDSIPVTVNGLMTKAEGGVFDLGKQHYSVETLLGEIKKFSGYGAKVDTLNLNVSGIDFAMQENENPQDTLVNLQLGIKNTGATIKAVAYDTYKVEGLRTKIEDLAFALADSKPLFSANIKEMALSEKSMAVDVKSLAANIKVDTTKVALDGTLATAASKISTHLNMDLSALDETKTGNIDARLDASIGRSDVLNIARGLNIEGANELSDLLPAIPMTLTTEAHGNTKNLHFPYLKADIPTLASVDVRPFDLSYPMNFDTPKFRAHAKAKVKTYRYLRADGDIDATISGSDVMYAANVTVSDGGRINSHGTVNYKTMTYNVDADVADMNVNSGDLRKLGMPNLNEYGLGDLRISGKMHADMHKIKGTITPESKALEGEIMIDALTDNKKPMGIKGTMYTDMKNIDLYKMNLVGAPLKIGLCGHFDIEAGSSGIKLPKIPGLSRSTDVYDDIKLNGFISDITIIDSAKTYHPDDIDLRLMTRRDTTRAEIHCGDFESLVTAQGGYEWLTRQFSELSKLVETQIKNYALDQAALRMALPRMNFYLRCGKNNPIYRIINYYDIDFDRILARVHTSREDGINGELRLHSLKTAGYQLDTIGVKIASTNDVIDSLGNIITPMKMSYAMRVQNYEPNDIIFTALVDGELLEQSLTMNTQLYDNQNELALNLGLEASVINERQNLQIHLTPDEPVLGYTKFRLNKDNHITLGKRNTATANMQMRSEDGTGIELYSTRQDYNENENENDNDNIERIWQDLTLSLTHVNLGKLTGGIPYAPRITGILDGDYHIVMNSMTKMTVSTDMNVQNMTFEGSKIGNLSTQFVYMPEEDGTHYVDGTILLDDNEIATIIGRYNNATDSISLTADMKKTPLSLINGFIENQIVGLEGTGEGKLDVHGTTSKPIVNGELFLENASLISIPYGLKMRFDDDPVRIVNSQLLLENFQVYSANNNPLVASGSIDFSDLDHINVNLRMKAENFLLIDAKEEPKSEAYGQAFVNFYCGIRGELAKLNIMGRLDVLPTTNLNYILKDSPITTDNRLNELVKFTDLNDTTNVVVVKPVVDGMVMNFTLNVMDGAHVKCWLNADHTNYLDLVGGGNMRMKYTSGETTLMGRYTISKGEMKYALPIIPLKTFTIADGSWLEFTGDILNPRMNIKATEELKTSVSGSGTNKMVLFNCGVSITKSLKDMGLDFIIEAPEDQDVTNELSLMSKEERQKVAITMLTTGMYLSDGNTTPFSMSSALNSFLQSEINNIAGNALKSLDFQMGVDKSTSDDGTMHTDYTFKFAKRFWNNRLNVAVGGKISTGNEVAGRNNSFFDNVDLQYRLSDTSNQYMRAFFKNNVYDFLEGYVRQYGAGYMYKRKLQKLGDLFKKQPAPTSTPSDSRRRSMNISRDSIPARRDSIPARKDSTAVSRENR